ncbi:MAG: FMN-binding protein [Lachnospiraceae bacterium]|nr:FMN-binding protein [Lachnospiraceae bacterium]
MSKKGKDGGVLSVVKDTLALVLITLAAAVLLGFVREVTAEPIAKREEQDKQNAYLAVFETASSVTESKDVPELAAALALSAQVLTEEYNKAVTVDEVCLAKDEAGNTVGYIITVTDKKGYGGAVQMVFGYSLDGVVTGIEFLVLNETAGFGLEAEKNPEWRKQFIGVAADSFTVTKTGAGADGEIDALSGATRTSNAVTQGINGGLLFAKYLAEQGIGGAK